ncbi:hypothetical protein QR680_004156 [Steinernema hermaphroditum]|uniref:Uncharacterized protein n=1 Tax=Steinernema hermaphroditum TaxID=289476 RepID=A0AA39LTJ9_9BILA|nr:hypothetical protein QR680_004156 [Steinernema hermaphroditum]
MYLDPKTLCGNAEAGPHPEKFADKIYAAAPVHGSPLPPYDQLSIKKLAIAGIAQIGHYGVKLILVVLFVVLLVVALAMLRHQSMMSYRHLNEKTLLAVVAVTPKNAEAGPLPEKSADNIYVAALVHGAPPPAYDQLSIKKVQQ